MTKPAPMMRAGHSIFMTHLVMERLRGTTVSSAKAKHRLNMLMPIPFGEYALDPAR